MLKLFVLRGSKALNHGRALRGLHTSSYFAKIFQFKLADIGEGIAEVELKEWYIKVGDNVAQFDNICEVQSDKAAVTITSRFDGTVKKLNYDVGSIAKVGSVLLEIETDSEAGVEDEKPAKDEKSASKAAAEPEGSSPSSRSEESEKPFNIGKVLATPAVRRVAMEHSVNLTGIKGTGKDGRVLKEDVLRHLGHIPQVSGSDSAGKEHTKQHQQEQVKIVPGEDKKVPVRGYTRAMVKSMSESLKIPHFGYNDEICVDKLVELRSQLKHVGKERGINLSYMPIIIKATSLALSKYPILNSSIDGNFENLIYKGSHNICLAIDTPGGLVVPNIKNCEQKSVWDIAADLNRLQEAGKKQQIRPDDLQGGTFTLSNIGAIGGTYAIPIIFPPQVAIGAIGKIQKLPRFDKDGNVYPAHLIKFSWAADHRVIDGATIARFSNLLKDYLENPAFMMTELR